VAFWKKADENDLLRGVTISPNRAVDPAPAPAPVSSTANPPAADSTAANSAAQAVRSSLGPDTSITGKLSFSAPTRIDGKLKGEIRATELLIIGEQAVVEGAVRARELILHGEVQGDVFGTDRVEIVAGGRLSGSVHTPLLIVREGALLNGDCRVTPAASTSTPVATPAPAAAPAKAGKRS